MAILSFCHHTFVFIFVITMATKQRLAVNVELGLVGIWQSTGGNEGVNSTPSAHTFFSCACWQRACPSLLSQLSRYVQPHSHALTPRTRVAQDSRWTLSVSCTKNSHTSSRKVIRYTSLDYTEHVHSFLIFDTVFLACLTSTSQGA